MQNKTKTNNTPLISDYTDPLELAIANMITLTGEDVTRPGLVDTPKRAAKSLRFLTQGQHQTVHDAIGDVIFDSDMEELVIVKDIELYSLCEHHLLPFIGKCHIGYLPNGKIIGLSKMARITDLFARRLQVQENLTQEIAECLMTATNAKGVGVIIEAQHLCMMMRGVEKQNSKLKTAVMLGNFRTDHSIRTEFFNLLK